MCTQHNACRNASSLNWAASSLISTRRRIEVLGKQAGPQGPLGHQSPLFCRGDLPGFEFFLPGLIAFVDPARVRIAWSFCVSSFWDPEALQVEQGVAIEQVAFMRREQNLQEVHSALGVGREERGEQVVADV